MNGTNDLKYSEEGKAARYPFLKQYNDINFFVEDEDKEYQYEEIFQRMFGKEFEVKHIFSTGGKPFLIERFKEFGKEDPDDLNKINVYLADGDFDVFLHAEEMIKSENFIYLKAYNIENYYIDKVATINFMRGILHKRKKEVEDIIDFNSWLKDIVEYAKEIFWCYCYIQKKYPEIVNVSRGPAFFIDEKTGFERAGAFERFISELNTKHGLDIEKDEDVINEIKENYKNIYGDSYFELICGKFLLWSLHAYLKSKASKKNIDYKAFEWDMICNFDINKLSYVKDKIVALIS